MIGLNLLIAHISLEKLDAFASQNILLPKINFEILDNQVVFRSTFQDVIPKVLLPPPPPAVTFPKVF